MSLAMNILELVIFAAAAGSVAYLAVLTITAAWVSRTDAHPGGRAEGTPERPRRQDVGSGLSDERGASQDGERRAVTEALPPGCADGERVPLRISVVVPAHNEEAGIGPTLDDLAAQEYPDAAYRVVVVADNCEDRTAEVAAAHVASIQGAEVLVRRDAQLRGKGYALRMAFDRLLADGWTQAVAVIDADTRVDAGFLAALDAAFASGAQAVQGRYRVRNPADSWRTRTAALALGIAHHVRPLACTFWGCSAGLKGNGMAFRAELLGRLPWDATSEVEDLEYACRLSEAGVYPAYVPAAVVAGEMPTSGSAAAVQRRRWEGGRRRMARAWTGRLLAASIRRGDWRAAEQAVQLVMPPLALLVGVCFGAFTIDLILGRGEFAAAWAVVSAGLAACVVAGPSISGEGKARDLAAAPIYVVWKAAIFLGGLVTGTGGWHRTPRNARLAAEGV